MLRAEYARNSNKNQHMKARRFFSLVWRINAIVIFIVGMLGALLLTAGAFTVFSNLSRSFSSSRPSHNAPPAAADGADATEAGEKQVFRLGSFERVQGTDVLRAAYQAGAGEDGGSGYGSKSDTSTRNFFYLDASTRSTYWLKPSMKSVILRDEALSEHQNSDESQRDSPKPEIASVYLVVENDSNGDGELTDEDKKQIAVSDATGKEYRVVAQGVDCMEQVILLGPQRVLILYYVGAKLKAAELNPLQGTSPIETYEVQTSLKKSAKTTKTPEAQKPPQS